VEEEGRNGWRQVRAWAVYRSGGMVALYTADSSLKASKRVSNRRFSPSALCIVVKADSTDLWSGRAELCRSRARRGGAEAKPVVVGSSLAEGDEDVDGDLLHSQVGAVHVECDGIHHSLIPQLLPHVLEPYLGVEETVSARSALSLSLQERNEARWQSTHRPEGFEAGEQILSQLFVDRLVAEGRNKKEGEGEGDGRGRERVSFASPRWGGRKDPQAEGGAEELGEIGQASSIDPLGDPIHELGAEQHFQSRHLLKRRVNRRHRS